MESGGGGEGGRGGMGQAAQASGSASASVQSPVLKAFWPCPKTKIYIFPLSFNLVHTAMELMQNVQTHRLYPWGLIADISLL